MTAELAVPPKTQWDPAWRPVFRRLLIAALVILLISALWVILAHHPEVWRPVWRWFGSPELKEWAVIVQIIGAIVTAAGLANAYIRGWLARFRGLASALGRMLVLIFRGAAGMKGQAERWGAQRYVAQQFVLDPITPDYKQIMQLNDFVNFLAQHVSRIDGNLVSLASDVEKHFDTNQSKLRELEKDLVNDQGIDLGWAIVGLLITTVGLVMSYGL